MSSAMVKTPSSHYRTLTGLPHRYDVHAFDLRARSHKVLVPTYAPTPFVLVPQRGQTGAGGV